MPWGGGAASIAIQSEKKSWKMHFKLKYSFFPFLFWTTVLFRFFPSFCMLHAFSYLPVPLHTREPPSLCLYTSILYESLCPASSVTACLWPRCFWERMLQDWLLLGLRVPKWPRHQNGEELFLKCVCLGCCCFPFSSKSCSPFHWPEKECTVSVSI